MDYPTRPNFSCNNLIFSSMLELDAEVVVSEGLGGFGVLI
jgi:hypothetical protein